MTDKQKSILDVALNLFAENTYAAVPTSLIASKAGVSEGLIFRHFGNKAGLLKALVQLGVDELNLHIQSFKKMDNPGERIVAIMELPFHIDEDEYPYWRLIYSLKWQNGLAEHDDLFAPLRLLVSESLVDLNYLDVDAETDLVLSYLHGFFSLLLLENHTVSKEILLKTLQKKYKS